MKGTSKSFPTLPYGQGHVLLTAIFFEEDGGVTGFVEEFLSVSAHGRNLKEARSQLTQATEEHMHEPGKVCVNGWRRTAA